MLLIELEVNGDSNGILVVGTLATYPCPFVTLRLKSSL